MEQEKLNGLEKFLTIFGGIGLLLALATDSISVVGRHLGMPITGTIEIVQVGVLIAGSLGILIATLTKSHANVHLLIERLSPKAQNFLGIMAKILSLFFIGSIIIGSIWQFKDNFGTYEESEILKIPLMPLRAIVILALLGVCALFVRQIFKGEKA